MSYSGELLVVPMAIAAQAAVVGTAAVLKGVGAVATAGIRLAHSAAQRVAVNSMKSSMKKITANAAQLSDKLAEEMEAAAAQCYSDYEHTIRQLEQEYEKEPDTTVFLEKCQQAQERLYTEIQNKRTQLESTAIAGIRREMQNGQAENERLRRETELSIQHITDEEERRKRAREHAVSAISEIKAMAEDIHTAYAESQLAQNAAVTCEASMLEAQRQLEEGLCEAAMISAHAAKDALILKVSVLIEAECRNRQLYADCKTLLQTIQQLMEQQKSISYLFSETRNGTARQQEIPDFSRYYRGTWETTAQTLQSCETQLTRDFHDYAPEQLQDLLSQLKTLQNYFMQETTIAYERLHNECLRQETGKLLFQRYRSLGYSPIPLTEEDRKISSLDALILRLEKEETGEKLYLRLNAVPDADGHMTMHIQMEDHTHYDGTDAEIEQARMQERLANCEVIAGSGVGKNLRIKQRCSNPGVRDTYQQ